MISWLIPHPLVTGAPMGWSPLEQYASPIQGEHHLPTAGTQGRIMISRRKIVVPVCVCMACAAVGAQAAQQSAKSFVEAIYAAYKGKNARGISLGTGAAVRRYFELNLAALIIKDRKQARGEVGKLDGDPFIDAADW